MQVLIMEARMAFNEKHVIVTRYTKAGYYNYIAFPGSVHNIKELARDGYMPVYGFRIKSKY